MISISEKFSSNISPYFSSSSSVGTIILKLVVNNGDAINTLQRSTPTLEINANTKIEEVPQTTRRVDRWTFFSATQRILTQGLRPHVLRAIMGRLIRSTKSNAEYRTKKQIYGYTKTQKNNLGYTQLG